MRDYINVNDEAIDNFEKAIKYIRGFIEDTAGWAFENHTITKYFEEIYNYKEGEDTTCYILDYIKDYYV